MAILSLPPSLSSLLAIIHSTALTLPPEYDALRVRGHLLRVLGVCGRRVHAGGALIGSQV